MTVLYISAGISPTHARHDLYRRVLDRPPDLDLCRIISSSGQGVRARFAERVVDATEGRGTLPDDLAPYSGIVIGGSVHCWAAERGTLEAWQAALIEYLRPAILDAQIPFLGLCGGGQIGLLALGGRVRPNPKPGHEVVQTSELTLTDDGLDDPIFAGCPPIIRMQEVHTEWLAELPSGCRVLSRSAELGHQVVAYGDHVRLFQPHPELTAEDLGRLLEAVSDVHEDPVTARAYGEAAGRLLPTPEANRHIVWNFLETFCGEAPRGEEQ